MSRWRIIGVLLLCLALVGTLACSPLGGGGEEVTQKSAEVARGDLMVSVGGSGKIEVSNEAKLTFGSGGKVDEILVSEGDEVSEGDVLAKLDADALELALSQAQVAHLQAVAARDQAEAAIGQAEVAVDQAEAARDQAKVSLEQADLNLELTELWSSAAQIDIAELQVEAAKSQLAAAESQLTSAELQVEMAKLQVKAAELQVKSTYQAVEYAQKQLDEATITAPFDGVVASVYVDEGDMVAVTTTIIRLIDLTTMELKVDVDEIDIAQVKAGQRVIIELEALPDLQLEGEVASVSLLAREEAGLVLYEVKVGFGVPEGIVLRVGMSATADIVIDERSGILLVPSRAIQDDSQGNPVVEVVVGEQIEERSVVTGISDGFDTEIVSGLSEGDVVVYETKTKATSPGSFF